MNLNRFIVLKLHLLLNVPVDIKEQRHDGDYNNQKVNYVPKSREILASAVLDLSK